MASLTLDDIHRTNFSPDALYALLVGKPMMSRDHTDVRPMLIFSQHGYSKVRSRLFFNWHSLLCRWSHCFVIVAIEALAPRS